MTESRWAERPWVEGGQDANTAGFATSARDLARFGLLVLRGGIWNGVDLLGNPGYLERALSPSQDLNPAYGYLWWLNGQERLRRAGGVEVDGPLIASAPADLVAAQGALGRTCYVVPSMDLVVTRLGDQPDEGFAEELWRLLLTTPTAADRIRR
jgi:CubicO group peptidase (beta-lactamase class C family)